MNTNPLSNSKMTDEEIKTMQRLGYQLNVLRHRKKMTVNELSEKCGIKPQNIIKIEAGSFYLRVNILNRILKALGYSIVFGEDNANTSR